MEIKIICDNDGSFMTPRKPNATTAKLDPSVTFLLPVLAYFFALTLKDEQFLVLFHVWLDDANG